MKILIEIRDALPEGSIEKIMLKTGKSKTTVYNVINKVHNGNEVINAMLDIIETDALEKLELVRRARRVYPKIKNDGLQSHRV